MRADSGVYPRLGKYFSTTDEFAKAACMTRPTLLAVFQGRREFTRSEKTAICGRLLTKLMRDEIDDPELKPQELLNPDSFDELFREKGA